MALGAISKEEKFILQNRITQLIKQDTLYITMYGLNKREDQVMSIKTKEISHFCVDWKGKYAFIYIWGFPGPDYNVYLLEDYGETWAFTAEELEVVE